MRPIRGHAAYGQLFVMVVTACVLFLWPTLAVADSVDGPAGLDEIVVSDAMDDSEGDRAQESTDGTTPEGVDDSPGEAERTAPSDNLTQEDDATAQEYASGEVDASDEAAQDQEDPASLDDLQLFEQAASPTSYHPAEPEDLASTVTAPVIVTIHPTSAPKNYLTAAASETAVPFSFASLSATTNQFFRIAPIEGTPYCLIRNVGSQLVLGVQVTEASSDSDDVPATTLAVLQQPADASAGQQWVVSQLDDGSYLLLSALVAEDGTRLSLASTASTLEVAPYDAEAPITWALTSTQAVEDGTYRLTPGIASNRALDVAKASLAAGANVQSSFSNGTNAQRYALAYDAQSGYYSVAVVASGMVLDVADGSTTSGANVQQAPPTGSPTQQWAIVPASTEGFYRLVSRASGLVLDVAGGSTASGANVRLWKSNDSKAQQWQLEAVSPLANGLYTISLYEKPTLGLDAAGGKVNPHTNLQLHALNKTVAQTFEVVEYATGLYTIRNAKSGLYAALHDASNALKTNIDLEDGASLDESRLWCAYPGPGGIVFVSASGLSLDVAGGKLKSGTNVWGYRRNNNASQRFVLKGVSGSLLGITHVTAVLPASDGTTAKVASQLIGGNPYLMLPSYANIKSLRLSCAVACEGSEIEAAASEKGSYSPLGPSGTINLSKGFSKDSDGAYVVWLRTKGTTVSKAFRIMVSANLPACFITSADPVNAGRAYVEAEPRVHNNTATGSMMLVGAKGQLTYSGELTQIRGRGNSTWFQVKKPYQIKLAKKASLIDGSADNKAKTWVLLANYLDSTMLRDHLSKKLALSLGLSNTPDSMLVDLYYDGEYRGTYQLGEKVQIGTGRIEIHDLEEDNEALNGDTSTKKTATAKNSFGKEFQYVSGIKNPSDITGGYIVELDQGTYANERCWFETTEGYFSVKAPEDASYAQVKYISEYVQRAINEGKKADGNLNKYLDVTSLAATALVNEVAKNPDWLRYASTFYYKDRGSSTRLMAGPVWDFDLAYGVARQDEETKYSLMAVEGLLCDQYGFYGNNKQFKTALSTAYRSGASQVKALVTGGSSGTGTIGDTAATIQRSWAMNRKLWPYKATVYVPMTLSSRDDANAHLWNWTAARVNWLNSKLGSSSTAVVSVGSKLSGTYTLVGGTGKVLDIEGGSTANKANVRMWSSNGSEAQKFTFTARGKTASGEWYYTITNVKSKKVLEAAGGKTAPGTNVQQYAYNGTKAQYWILRRTSSDSQGRYQIVNYKSGLALDIVNGEKKNGTNVALYLVCGNNAAQNWYLR